MKAHSTESRRKALNSARAAAGIDDGKAYDGEGSATCDMQNIIPVRDNIVEPENFSKKGGAKEKQIVVHEQAGRQLQAKYPAQQAGKQAKNQRAAHCTVISVKLDFVLWEFSAAPAHLRA